MWSFMICTVKYYSGDKSRRKRWARHVACRGGERRGVYRVLVRKTEGKRPLGRHRLRRENNTEKEVQDVGWGHGVD